MKDSKKKGKSRKVKVPLVIPQEELIDFDTWFWFAVMEKQVRNEQKSELKAFFTKKGLKNKEIKQKFYEILTHY